MAKTTGSQPVIIYPNGSEREIRRRGRPTILEEKKILKAGVELKVEALVTELMSIHPESLFVEAVQMLKPHILIVTNIRLDHMAQMGTSKERIASCFASSIPENCTVFIPREEYFPQFQDMAEKSHSKIVQVNNMSFDKLKWPWKDRFPFELEENVCLSIAVTDFLNINREKAFQGMSKRKSDFGSLRIWESQFGSSRRTNYFISCFAANDPESTRRVLLRLQEKKVFNGMKWIGLLNLRSDRGDRTLQWLNALEKGEFQDFSEFILMGEHAAVFKKRLKSKSKYDCHVLSLKQPEEIMFQISEMEKEEAVIVGMGNMGGIGVSLVKYWEGIGETYDF